MLHDYDIIVFGAGIAGLWLGNVLKQAGYNVIVVEKDKVGAGQTLVSQGMIHGGQKYVLQGLMTPQAVVAARMPERWQASFEGRGEIDLRSVRMLSNTQIMWPAGSFLSSVAAWGAAKLASAEFRVLDERDVPEALKTKERMRGRIYMLPEKVLDMRSLMGVLADELAGRILKGEIADLRPDGRVAVCGHSMRAQRVIFTAGTGNELALSLLKVKEQKQEQRTQRRPLRQIMVRPLPYPLFGHGIAGSARPRITVTSHSADDGQYLWYIGGAIAETGADMAEAAALGFAKKEMQDIFPEIDWAGKEWATWYGDRAEPLDAKGELPAGPLVHQNGRILVAWPTKLTFAPALSDLVLERLKDIQPAPETAPPPLPVAEIGSYPWEAAAWRAIA